MQTLSDLRRTPDNDPFETLMPLLNISCNAHFNTHVLPDLSRDDLMIGESDLSNCRIS